MHTTSHTRARSLRPHHQRRAPRVLRPTAGQCFEIEVNHDGRHWQVRVPELAVSAETPQRSAVEFAARERIADHTGIPIGYISVWARD